MDDKEMPDSMDHDATGELVETGLQFYKQSSILRPLVNAIPVVGGGLDALASTTLVNLRESRERKLYDALEARQIRLTDARARSETFIGRYLVTYAAVIRESQEDKIHLFANLMANGESDSQVGASEFQELLQILEELSARELTLLQILERHESAFGHVGSSDVQYTSQFWNSFLAEAAGTFGITKEEISAMVARLARTGCYKEIVGSYTDYTGGQGTTTLLWKRFKDFVLNEKAKTEKSADAGF